MTLRSTQPLTERSIRNISWWESCQCVGLTTLLLSCVNCLYIWESQSPGTFWACNRLVKVLHYSYLLTERCISIQNIAFMLIRGWHKLCCNAYNTLRIKRRALNIKKVIHFYPFFLTLQNLKTMWHIRVIPGSRAAEEGS